MRLVIFGATGNVGTSLLRVARGRARGLREIIARRAPAGAGRSFRLPADALRRRGRVAVDDLGPMVPRRGRRRAPGLVDPAEPRPRADLTWVNVVGSERVARATVAAGVPALLYASSVGAYFAGTEGQDGRRVLADTRNPSSIYSRHKVAVERQLDRLEREQPQLRVVRMRPALIFKAEAATEIRRLFAGPLLPGNALRPALIPLRSLGPRSLLPGGVFRLMSPRPCGARSSARPAARSTSRLIRRSACASSLSCCRSAAPCLRPRTAGRGRR